MPRFQNVSPQGALDLPLIGRVVDAGEVIEVSTAQAKHLKGQTSIWRPVTTAGSDDPATTGNAPQSAAAAAQDDTGEGEHA
jgi:hypothetical protein